MTDNRTTELLPCPICGGQPDFQHFNITPKVKGRIVCSCGIELRQGENDTDDDVRIIWNTRTATTDAEFARAVHDGNLWRRVKGHIRCRNCGLNIESVIALDGCNEHAIKHCPNCGHKVVG